MCTFDTSSNETFFREDKYAGPIAYMSQVMMLREAGLGWKEVAEIAAVIDYLFATSWIIAFTTTMGILFAASCNEIGPSMKCSLWVGNA